MLLITRSILLASALAVTGSSALAGVLVTDSHSPRVLTKKNQLIQNCVTAIQEHWEQKDGLVLRQRARYGKTADGTRVITVAGTVWRNGVRADVSHQCSDRPGPNRLALHVRYDGQLAAVNSERL